MEGGESITPSQVVKEEGKKRSEVFDFREKQDSTDRLCEYLTGLGLIDEKLPGRLEEDQKIIRAKYGLPERQVRFNVSGGYERFLRNLAKTNRVEVRATSDCGDFFKKGGLAGGVYLEKNKAIGVDIKTSDEKSYYSSLVTLEHETIHALQHKFYPGMGIEQREYEAYVSGWNTQYLKENPDSLELVFSFALGSSVGHFYRSESETRGKKLESGWDNPNYFLKKVDGFSDKEIENYRNKKEVADTEKESLGFVGDSVK